MSGGIGAGEGTVGPAVKVRPLQQQAPADTGPEGEHPGGLLVGSLSTALCWESPAESSCMWVAHPHPRTVLEPSRLSIHVCGLRNTWVCVSQLQRGEAGERMSKSKWQEIEMGKMWSCIPISQMRKVRLVTLIPLSLGQPN